MKNKKSTFLLVEQKTNGEFEVIGVLLDGTTKMSPSEYFLAVSKIITDTGSIAVSDIHDAGRLIHTSMATGAIRISLLSEDRISYKKALEIYKAL